MIGGVARGEADERAALQRLLTRPALARLWAAARHKLETLGRLGGNVELSEPSAEEREAVADLLGLRLPPRGALRVSLTRLEGVLRRSRFGVGLEEALALAAGPVRNRVAERLAVARAAAGLWAAAEEHPLVAEQPALRGFLADLRASGLLRRLGGEAPAAVLDQGFRVLGHLLARDEGAAPVRLPVLANQLAGSSHALDAGTPLATLVLKALARLTGAPSPTSASERRALWEGVGVVVDELSNAVLTLGLKPESQGPTAEALRALAAAGEPVVLTLRQLRRGELTFGERGAVFVCENPAVVAEAAEVLGQRCPALICLGGMPNQAGRALLASLVRQGARLLYHGDFDWPGIRIANALGSSLPFEPWRFQAADYREALPTARDPLRLEGPTVAAHWDPELEGAMREGGVVIEEEAVLGGLLGDLGGGLTPRPDQPQPFARG